MRLINTSTGHFKEFLRGNIPKYAILSHTWEEEGEVSFTAMSDPSPKYKKGRKKIEKTCEMTSKAGLSYAWVDTCCIDKSSSAELTEAINSMYRWYERSDICYAYLSDLPPSSSLETALEECRWFKRGWTLQELIAPKEIYFFDEEWNCIGSKRDLAEHLSRIAGISTSILQHEQRLSSVAVAQRLSWAAKRKTTRIEDQVYSLLGIFDVNMPLLYGEENKAFRRLQEEIIRTTADFSIFAWTMPSDARSTIGPNDRVFCGILAEAPTAFASCATFVTKLNQERQEFSVSNIGVKTQVRILSQQIPGKHATRYVLPLTCSSLPQHSLGVRLRKCGPDQFIREDPWNLVKYTEHLFPNAPGERYLLTGLPEANLYPDSLIFDMSLFMAPPTPSHVLQIKLPAEMEIYEAWPWDWFDDEDQVFFVSGNPRWDCGALRLRGKFTAKIDQRWTKVDLECMFYAVGWSELTLSSLMCTLVDYRSFDTQLNELQSHLAAWDHDREEVLGKLKYHKIPRSPLASWKIPGTKTSAFVSFTPTLMSDPSICRNKFWRIEFSWDLCETHNLPRFLPENWNYI
jgi:hypothetical protein